MKRSLSLLLALTLVLSMLPSALAADITASGAQSSNTQVTYGVSESYTVTVPEAATMDIAGIGSITVSVSNAMLASNGMLNVYILGDSYTSNVWHLTNTATSSETLAYNITKNTVNVAPEDIILTVSAGTAWNTTVSQVLNLALAEEVEKAGIYTDQLTFVVEYNDGTNVTLEKNEYGFYYAQPYRAEAWATDGAYATVPMDMIFYDDNTAVVWSTSGVGYWTNVEYAENEITMAGTTFNVLDDGNTVRAVNNTNENGAFLLTPMKTSQPAAGMYQVQYNPESMVGVKMIEYCPGVSYEVTEDAVSELTLSLENSTIENGKIIVNDNIILYHPNGQMLGYATNNTNQTGIFLTALKVSNVGKLHPQANIYYNRLYYGYTDDYSQKMAISVSEDDIVTMYMYTQTEGFFDGWLILGQETVESMLQEATCNLAPAPYGFYLDGTKLLLLPDDIEVQEFAFGKTYSYRNAEENTEIEMIAKQDELWINITNNGEYLTLHYIDGVTTIDENGIIEYADSVYDMRGGSFSLGINANDDFAVIALASADGQNVILGLPVGTWILSLEN